jgi:NADPH:quinone reductase
MNTMRAAVLKKYGEAGSAFEIQQREIPQPGKGQVLIRVKAFGLNYADVMARRGLYDEAPPLPCVLGYDVTGVVEKTGEGVDVAVTGKNVVALTRFGGYAEYALTDSRAVIEIPENTNVAVATALATQYATAWFAAYERANLCEGERILVHAAAGGVGTAIIQLAKLKNCEIYALAGNDEKIKMLEAAGVKAAINYNKTDYEKEVFRLLKKNRLDVCFNSVAGKTFKKDMRLLGVNGRSVLYGFADRSGKKYGLLSTISVVFKMGIIIPVQLVVKTKSVSGINMLKLGDYKPEVLQRCMTGVGKLFAEGKIHPISGGVFPAEKLAEAHALLESRKSVGKIAVQW